MKLYATMTSERASKSQGGNEKIGISLKGSHGTEIVNLEFSADGAGYALRGGTHDNQRIDISIGEKTSSVLKGSEYSVKDDKGNDVVFESIVPGF